MPSSDPSSSARTRMTISSPANRAAIHRIVAAVLGGYAFANAIGIFLSRVLPMSRADAVLTMTLSSFALYAAAIVWAFAAGSARRAWIGLLAPAAACGLLAWLVGAR